MEGRQTVPVMENSVGNMISKLEKEQTQFAPKMDFKETFKLERGVEYDENNVSFYLLSNSKMQVLTNLYNSKNYIDENLDKSLNQAKLALNNHASQSEIKENEIALSASLEFLLTKLFLGDEEKIAKKIQNILQLDSAEGLVKKDKLGIHINYKTNENLNLQNLIKIAQEIKNSAQNAIDKEPGGTSFEDYKKRNEELYEKAYGKTNAAALANKFVQSQKEGVGTVKATAQYVGVEIMIAGQFIPGVGQSAGLMMGGALLGAFGGVAVDGVEAATKNAEITSEELRDLKEEFIKSIGYFLTGMGIGKLSSKVGEQLLAQSPKLVAKDLETCLKQGEHIMASSHEVRESSNLKIQQKIQESKNWLQISGANHEYAVKGYDSKRELVFLTNPHNANEIIQLDLEYFMRYFSDYTIFSLK